jgi:hypothetical protein
MAFEHLGETHHTALAADAAELDRLGLDGHALTLASAL